MIKTELIRDYMKRAWTRWGPPQQIDPQKLTELVVSDILDIIEQTKPPTKNYIIKNIRKHYFGE